MKITNPIIPGETINAKEFRLDIHLLLNDNTLINLEMQITNRLNWQNRSVMYLCRSYDQLNRGQEYQSAKPAMHIGFLDYTLFSKCPEFYACYKLINLNNHQVYSNNLTLYVADLSRIDLATDEDRRFHIDKWAGLFKATTWEEIRMIASDDDALYEAAKTLFYKNSDEEIRMRCLDCAEYYQDLRNYERKIEQDRLEHEQDLRNYEQKIEQDRLEHEQDLRNYQQKIEQDRLEYEQDRKNYQQALTKKQEELDHSREYYKAQIRQLRSEIAHLKQQ